MNSITLEGGHILLIEKNSEKWNCQKCGAELKELKINKQIVHVCPKCNPDFRERYTVIDGFTHPAGTAKHIHPKTSRYQISRQR